MLNKVVIPGLFPYWLSIFLFLFSLLSIEIYDELVKKKSSKLTVTFVVLAFLISIYFAFYSLATYLEIWGPGIYLACLSIPLTIMLFLSWLRKLSTDYVDCSGTQRGYLILIGGFSVVFMQLAPSVGFFTISNYCYRQTERVGLEIANAMEVYRSDRGVYPDELSKLVPEYLEEEPLPPCTNLYRRTPNTPFRITFCESGETLLVTWLLNVYRYNLDSGNWSQVDWLEGSDCAFLN